MEKLLKFLFPPKCIFCGRVGDIFCDACLAECTLLQDQRCLVCDQTSPKGFTHKTCLEKDPGKVPTRLLCIYSYQGKVRDCIRFSKYGARQFLSMRKLCEEAAILCSETWGAFKADLCLPIPSSPKKLAYRGFNQANMIAEVVSKRFDIELKKDVLVRIRDTESQHSQDREQRRANVRESFGVHTPKAVWGKRVLVVDDICTTGATFLEASRVLYEAGAADVQCFALSKREKFCYNNRA